MPDASHPHTGPSPRFNTRATLVAGASLCIGLAISGCSVEVTRRGFDDDDGATATGAASPYASWGVGCPTEEPAPGDPCATWTACTYGDNVLMRCRSFYSCTVGGWELIFDKVCDAPDGPPKGHDCPATVPANLSACAEEGAYCAYHGGTMCDCFRGDITLCTYTPGEPLTTWKCKTPEPGCPALPPNLGTPCEIEGLACHYGNVSGQVQAHAWCTGGFWVNTNDGPWCDP